MANLEHNNSKFIRHEPCEACGSKDNKGVYDDGHTHCFGCGAYTTANDDGVRDRLHNNVATPGTFIPLKGIIQSIHNRNIDEATCRHYGYEIGEYNGDPCHIANYRGEAGGIIAQSLRRIGKQFTWLGDGGSIGFFGQQMWDKGRKLTITEGVIDCLSVSQAFGNKYPVVSLPNGAQSASKYIKANYAWLDSFEHIVLMFDMDETGQKAALEVANLLPMGKVSIAKLPMKDANECLVAGDVGAITKAFWDAKPFRPDGIVGISDIYDSLFEPVVIGPSWPWPTLTRLTYGRQRKHIYAFGAGVGVGKTDCFTECINHDLNTHGFDVGVIYLEQPTAETVMRITGKMKSKLFHVPDAGWTGTEYKNAVDELKALNKLWLYNHFGQMDWLTIKGKIQYFAKALNCKHIYLDHLTALIAGVDDERRALDAIMADMSSLAHELDINIYFISHLTTPTGDAHEEGGRVLEKHFTGSRAIARWAHFMFGLERDKQAEDLVVRSTTTFRILKDRFTGQSTGVTFPLFYNKDNGRLTEGVF